MPRSPESMFRTTWSEESLRSWIAAAFDGESIIVLANRQPLRHDRAADGSIAVSRSSGGLVTALEPLMQACAGVWVAHGSGTADRLMVDQRDGVGVPPARPLYRLRRVWLDAAEQRGYYYGFANEALWPLCHRAHVRPVFRRQDFETYRTVNERFADAVYDEAETDRPVVLVQDYHFALAPQMIRARLPRATIVAFWHIPWPSAGDYAICPWRRQLLEGLLASDIVGFQTPDDCRAFSDSAERVLGAARDRKEQIVVHAGRQTAIRAYPVSIEWPSQSARRSPAIAACRSAVRTRLGLAPDVLLGIGVDRLDYTKGITEKFLAVEQLLDSHPEFRGRFAFAQIAEPSRECLASYRELRSRVWTTAERINARYGTDRYRPIALVEGHHDHDDVYLFLRAADLCYVGSLHDGMNLVAKEFVGARDDEHGVLVLSEFAGAARELTAALIVNPYAIDDAARALAVALRMPDVEQSNRMRAMRAVVGQFNTYRWAGEMLADAARVRRDGFKEQHDGDGRVQAQQLHA